MNHDTFLQTYLGGKYRETVKLGYQCVALAKLYYKEVYNISWLSFWGWAINGWKWDGNLDTFFDRYTEGPQLWDLVFYAPTPGNIYGHVAIYISSKNNLEQNGGSWNWSGTGADAIRIGRHQSILWYMRSKQSTSLSDIETEWNKMPKKFRRWKSYTDTTPITRREARMLIDLDHYRT